jgi:hypothetical protein
MMMMRSLHPPHFTALLLLVWACRITVVAGGFQPILPARTLARGSSYSSRQLLLEDTTLLAFLPRGSTSSRCHGQEQHTKMKEDDANEETQQRAGTEDEFWSTRKEKSFNPFDYNASSLSGSSRSHGTTTSRSNTVSLRSIQMKALNERLFAAVSSEERRTILTEEQDMLLAPIWDGDTAVGSNLHSSSSIYQQCRSSEERFVAFDNSLTERIQRAQSAVVKTILQEMKDFVMDQQRRQPPPQPQRHQPPPHQ